MTFLSRLVLRRNSAGFALASEIDRREITILSATDAERNAKVFSWRGGLYRGILPRQAALYERLFESGFIDRLIAKGLLVPTRRTTLRLSPFAYVIEHERIPYITYPFEWCAAMLRDAALTILAMQEELTREGLELQDGHTFNVLFDGVRPHFVDFGSIVQAEHQGVWSAWTEFCRYNLYPLAVTSAGFGDTSRMLLRDFLNAVPGEVAERLCPSLVEQCTHRALAARVTDQAGRLRFLDALRRDVESIPLRRTQTEWSDYYGDALGELEPNPGWRLKQHTAWNVLSRLRPQTVIDIASNRGLYAQTAAKHGARVIAFDRDEVTVSDMYCDAKSAGANLTPLVMDLMNPSPSLGIGIANTWFPSAHERLQADFALASALVHHMVFKMWLNFSQIAEILARFTRKWLLVEFIPREDRHVSAWWTEDHGWYTMENFAAELRKRFRHIEVLPSDPDPRVFLLCEI